MTTADESDDDESVDAPPEHPVEERGSLKSRVLRGSLVEMSGYVLSLTMRFGGNLVMTRLLAEEAFGLMAFLTAVNTGLILLSDVGIEQAVIRSEHGDDEKFLDTAWTLQMIRGGGLWFISLALAYPLALSQGQMELVWLIPIASLDVVLAGFGSTKEFSLRRRLEIGRIMMLDLFVQALALGVMITWAYYSPSVWALVAGVILREGTRSLLTHFFFDPGRRQRFCWDPAARREIIDFGRWILFSSGAFYFASYGDRLLLMPTLGAAGLGVYSIAALITEAAYAVIGKVVHGVLYPVFGKVRLEGVEALRDVYYRIRLRLDLLSMGGIGVLAMIGPTLVELLWDERYHGAGWMLQLLCLKGATRSIFDPAEKCLMSLGLVKLTFFNNLARTIWLFAGVPIGWHVAEHAGVVWAVATTDVPSALILWPALFQQKVLRIERELLSWVYFGVGLGAGYGIDALLTLLIE